MREAALPKALMLRKGAGEVGVGAAAGVRAVLWGRVPRRARYRVPVRGHTLDAHEGLCYCHHAKQEGKAGRRFLLVPLMPSTFAR